jgi:3-hydroxyisobutyrate dehydrogenase-like beta-hydroxyacid dehydrogenase
MTKNESSSRVDFPGASATASLEQRGGSGSNSRPPAQGEIGFVGLGQMGTAMAANLAATEHRVIVYIRHPEQMVKLEALGPKPTTNISDLFDCGIVISMLPDDDAVREIAFGREEIGLDGLAMGLKPGAIHLSMSTISTQARRSCEHDRRHTQMLWRRRKAHLI